MRFRTWLEVVELSKPHGRVHRSIIVKDKGTNVAKESTQFKWTTALGNVVKLQFDHDGPNSYRVMFYVNDTLFDDAASNQNNGRDPEILSGIFYLLKNKATALGAEQLTFTAHKSDADTKVIRNVDPEQYKRRALYELQQFASQVQNHQVQMVPPSETKINLWRKLKRGEPQPMPDFRQDLWLKWIQSIHSEISQNKPITQFFNQLKTGIGVGDFSAINFSLDKLTSALTDFDNAVASNSTEGWERTRNRRAAVYTKLVNRYLSDDWDIKIDGDWFRLTRKQ